MTDKHLSTQFDEELEVVSARVIEMGGLAESQVTKSFSALLNFTGHDASLVLDRQPRLRMTGVAIDRDLSSIVVRRQPAARDLRSLVAFSKIVGHLERIGDEAVRIALVVQHLLDSGASRTTPLSISDLGAIGKRARIQLRDSLTALESLNVVQARGFVSSHRLAGHFDDLAKELTGQLSSAPHEALWIVDVVLVASCLERIGDYSKRLCEQIIYAVDGPDDAEAQA